ncbi:MAG TPA: bacillithiol biosynthesis cysteine-adding enzyme BshC [Bryobacteraceae bacterium]|nr:bacillithiol biosynthesis cysteine-adding enzyme BshC [Bryobacteraceae bacterium]
MHCTCVRQTELPGATRLYADVLYHPDRTARFYPHPIRDLAAYRAAAAENRFPDERRAALVAALGQQNPRGTSLERLAQPGTLVVATGQQVGLFSGPAYTVYKALHAARLAEWLTANGIPAVPAFWLATEDHDFAEVNHAVVFGPDHRPRRLEMRRAASSQPVGEVTLENPPLDELRGAMEGLPFADEVTDLVAAAYRPSVTMGQAFGDLLRKLLGRFDILQVDPMLPAFRELAAAAIGAAVELAPDLSERILARNRELTDAGYHAQVHIEAETSLVFLLEGGKRVTLRRRGNEYSANGRRFAAAELAARAASLSPNALLRPVVQDSMLPTIATIGGPAEVAYLAQSEVIYRTLLGRMPVAVPRTGFTVLDERSAKKLARYDVGLQDCFAGEEAFHECIAARLIPAELSRSLHGTIHTVEAAIGRLNHELLAFDPTLAKAAATSARKIRHQLGKIQAKTGRETMRRSEKAGHDAASLYGLLYPERHLQERLYSMLPFLAKHGLELIDQVYSAIELGCPDHRLMVV